MSKNWRFVKIKKSTICCSLPFFPNIWQKNLQKSEVKGTGSDSMSEWEKRLEKPSVPLAAKGPPGPPKIVEIEKKYSAIEGTNT